jgi:hypothetical protein
MAVVIIVDIASLVCCYVIEAPQTDAHHDDDVTWFRAKIQDPSLRGGNHFDEELFNKYVEEIFMQKGGQRVRKKQ